MQWGNKRKILNFKKKHGEKTDALGNHKYKQKNKINKPKWTLVLIRRNKFLKINNLKNPQWNTQKNKKVSIRHKDVLKFRLIPHPHCPKMTCRKHHWTTNLIQVQGKRQPNQ